MVSSRNSKEGERETKRYKILYVSTYAETWGGGEFSFLGLLKNLDRRSFAPEVVLLAQGEMEDLIRQLGVKVLSLPAFNPDRFSAGKNLSKRQLIWRAGAPSLRAVFRIYKYIKKNRIDLVHAQCWKSSLIAGLSARMAGVPLVRHERTLPWHGPADHLCSAIATHIIAVSEAAANKFLGKVPARKIFVIKNGVDLQQFRESLPKSQVRREFGVLPDCPLIAVVGQLAPWKGHIPFLEAASLVIKAFPTTRFLIVGHVPYFAPPDYGNKLKQKVKDLNISEAVIFTGYRKDIPDIMSNIDILVVPSLIESFGRVAIEAMASGKPVVAARSGGLPEIIDDGVTGLLVPPGDPAAMAEALIALIRDRAKGRMMGKAGRARAEEKFSMESNVRQIEGLYARILSHGRGSENPR